MRLIIGVALKKSCNLQDGQFKNLILLTTSILIHLRYFEWVICMHVEDMQDHHAKRHIQMSPTASYVSKFSPLHFSTPSNHNYNKISSRSKGDSILKVFTQRLTKCETCRGTIKNDDGIFSVLFQTKEMKNLDLLRPKNPVCRLMHLIQATGIFTIFIHQVYRHILMHFKAYICVSYCFCHKFVKKSTFVVILQSHRKG